MLADVDGSSTEGVDARTFAIGVMATTCKWRKRTRIEPGEPDASLLFELANTRDADDPDWQMPPIASQVVDPDGIALLRPG